MNDNDDDKDDSFLLPPDDEDEELIIDNLAGTKILVSPTACFRVSYGQPSCFASS